MTVGWFTGVVPFTVPVDPNSFEETARGGSSILRCEYGPRECAVRSRLGVGPLAEETLDPSSP